MIHQVFTYYWYNTGIAEQKSPQNSPLSPPRPRSGDGFEVQKTNARINIVVKSNTLLPITLQHPNSSLAFDSTGCLINFFGILIKVVFNNPHIVVSIIPLGFKVNCDLLVFFPFHDHCFTKGFQITNPGDRYFYSLGLAGICKATFPGVCVCVCVVNFIENLKIKVCQSNQLWME